MLCSALACIYNTLGSKMSLIIKRITIISKRISRHVKHLSHSSSQDDTSRSSKVIQRMLGGLRHFIKSTRGLVVIIALLLSVIPVSAAVGMHYLNVSLKNSSNRKLPDQSPLKAKGITDQSSPTPLTSGASSTTHQDTGNTPTTQSSSTPTSTSSCVKTNIIPYTTTYQYRDYIASGQSTSSGGTDGFTLVCTAYGGYNRSDIFQPINKTIYVGTGQSQAQTDAAAQAAADQAARTAANARNDRIAACISSINAQAGASGTVADTSQCYSIP